MKNTPNYYSPSTVAEMLNVDRATVWRYARKGYFDIIYIGNIPRITAESLDNYLKNAKKYTPPGSYMNTLIFEKLKPLIKAAVDTKLITQEEYMEIYESENQPDIHSLKLYTVVDAANMLSVSRTKAWDLIKRGLLEVVYIADMPRVPATSVQQLVDSSRNAS